MSGRDQRSDRRTKTIDTEERAIKRENKNTNNMLVSLALLFVAAAATLFLTEADEKIVIALSYIVVVPYNGISSLVGWDLLLIEEVYSALATVVIITFYCALGIAYYCNKQQR